MSVMILHILYVTGVAAEAVTAALAAGRRSMDWVGVCLLAAVTALGGGSVRDVLLGHHPLIWVAHPGYLLLIAAVALTTVAVARFMHRLRRLFLLLDAVGLVVFTVIGCNIGIEAGVHPIIVIVAGMVTGTAGGIVRDVLCNDVPLIFQGELYATVSMITGIVYYMGLTAGAPIDLMVPGSIILGFSLRTAALVLKWEMPKFVFDRNMRK